MPFVLKKMYAEKKQRAFLYLIKELGYTQREAQRLIAKGRLLIDGEAMTKTTYEIEGEFEFISFEPATRDLNPHAVYDEFVIFDKPSGVLIHPQNRNTAYSLIDELKYQFGMDANIAHRIDQETSGLVLCARNKKSERDIKMMFQERDMQKKYLAMVHGEFKESIVVDAPLLRAEDESAMVRMVVKVDDKGKPSKTSFKPLKYFPHANTTLVECSPHTGRQHQIRVHLFHVKHPIVGDPVYGVEKEFRIHYFNKTLTQEERLKKTNSKRMLLHANSLEFELYGKKYSLKSGVDFKKIALENIAM